MSEGRDPFLAVIEYILSSASDDELLTVEEAIRRRRQKGPLDRMNFRDMARETASRVETQMPDIHAMTRRLVGGIIMEQQPGIPQAHLDALLDHFAPDSAALSARARAREGQLPPEILSSMMRQFVAFSLGRMPAAEERDLRQSMPDWPERYWEAFSEETRIVLRDMIREAGGAVGR
ncbi:MAG: hypothetical protein K1X75_09895 [Leptospirales bacterium]|nr:hypothetical protein [Leptospirales bacterium]